MDGVSIGSVNLDEGKTTDARIEAYKSYKWGSEILSLIARIFITIAIEMVVAIIFGFRNKEQLILLVSVNTATQVLLNVLLNTVNYFSGEFMLVFYYVIFEIIVFALEAILYCKLMNRFSEIQRKKRDYVGYSFLANTISFVAGLWLAMVIPGIF